MTDPIHPRSPRHEHVECRTQPAAAGRDRDAVMSRPDPRGPRRRPPAPRRRRPRPRGFSAPGWKQCFDLWVPYQGRERRRFFNMLSGRIVLALVVVFAAVGWEAAGPLVGLVGLLVGLAAGGQAVGRGRF